MTGGDWLEIGVVVALILVEAAIVVAGVRAYDRIRERRSALALDEDLLRGLVAAHETLGADERRLIDDVFGAGQRTIGEVMVPRPDVAFLEASLSVHRAGRIAAERPHQRYPVYRESQDDVVGYVTLLELLLHDPRTAGDRTVGQLARDIAVLPGSKPVLAALSELRSEGNRIALVVDEYGGTDGIVTLDGLVEEIVGEIQSEDGADADAPLVVADGIEVDGKLNLDEVAEIAGLELPDGPYATLGGFVMAELGSIPTEGAEVSHEGYTLTVVSVEGRRASRIRLSRVDTAETPSETLAL